MADDTAYSLPEPLQNRNVFLGIVAVLAVVAGIVAVVALGGGPDELLWALAGGIGIAVVVGAAYEIGRRYGQPHSHAVAQAGIIFGVVVLAAVVAELLRASGELTDGEIAVGLVGSIVATAVIVGIIAAIERFGSAV